MKKWMAIALVGLFSLTALSPAVFADCANKGHGTKTADEPQPKTDRA